jgi:hypothetical protein
MMSGGHFPEEPGLLNVFLQKNKIITGLLDPCCPNMQGLTGSVFGVFDSLKMTRKRLE